MVTAALHFSLRTTSNNNNSMNFYSTLGTRGNSLAKSGRPKAGETSVRSEVSEASEGPNASSLWWRTPTVSLCQIQILYLITDWLFKKLVSSSERSWSKQVTWNEPVFSVRQNGVLWRRNVYSKGILLKAKIYIVLVSKFEKTTTLNKQQERALWTFMSRKDDFANWVWKISDFSTLWQFTWQSGTIL